MTPRALPQIGLGDLVHAADTLTLHGEGVALAAELLGLGPPVILVETRQTRSKHGAGAVTSRARVPETRGNAPTPDGAGGSTPGFWEARTSTAADASAPSQSDLRVLPVSVAVKRADALPAASATKPLSELLKPGAAGPPPQGLFPPRSRRALLRGLSAVRAREGAVEIDACIDAFAAKRALTRIPLQWLETTRGGVQLLLDVGAGMEPYEVDVQRLPLELSRVVGSDRLEIGWFEDCPYPAGVYKPGDERPTPYRLPIAGTRVVAVTVFGARGPLPASRDIVNGWRRLAAACRRSRLPLVVLTPVPARRLPAALSRRIAVVAWDRTTSVASVMRAVRAARRA